MIDEQRPEQNRSYFRRHKIAGSLLLCVGAILVYRVLGVYTIRGGRCIPTGPVATRLPRAPLPDPASESVVILSYNIQGHAALVRDQHLAGIAKVIRDSGADIVGLQEVHRGTWQSRFRDQAEELSRLTRMKIAYGPSFRLFGGEFGNAVLTRGTIESSEVRDLPGVGEPRSLLRTVINLDGRRLSFFVTHLAAWGGWNRSSRMDQVQCVIDSLRQSRHPFVLVGDLNATPDTEEMMELQRGAVLKSILPKDSRTHKVTGQMIDYLMISSEWQAVAARVLDDGPSDHRPLVAELRW